MMIKQRAKSAIPILAVLWLLGGCASWLSSGDPAPPGDNSPPVISGGGVQAGSTAPETGESITLSVTATDPEGEQLTFSWKDDSSAYGTFTGTGSSVSWICDFAGTYTITVTVTDSNDNSVDSSVTIVVEEPGPPPLPDAPLITSFTFDPPHVDEGATATLMVVATDPQGETLTYTWEDDNAASGEFVGSGATVTWSADTAGEYEITCTVTNESALSVSDSIEIHVESHEEEADISAMRVADASLYYTGDAAVWSSVSSVSRIVSASSVGFETTGNPSSGGHGNLGALNLVTIEMKAVHDGTNFAFRYEWADETQNDTGNYWTNDTGTWSRSGNEDRLYMMFETGDPTATGRMGQTFSEVGCAMVCHGRLDGGNTAILDTTTELHNCSYCHLVAPGAQPPTFVHMETTLACDTCHEDRGGEPGPLLNDADMISPSANATYDVWHWKAGRSNPLGIVDDQYLPPALRRKDDGGGLNGTNSVDSASAGGAIPLNVFTDDRANGATSYLFQSEIAGMVASDELATWDEANGSGPGYYLSDGVTPFVPADGATVPRNIHNDDDIVGDRTANTFADGVYADGNWTLVVHRLMAPGETDDNGDPTDKDFVVGETYTFGLAVTNSSGHNHKGKNHNTIHFED